MWLYLFKTAVLLTRVDNAGQCVTPTFEVCESSELEMKRMHIVFTKGFAIMLCVCYLYLIYSLCQMDL